MPIYAIGDVHGNFESLNTFINKKYPDIILQCGDNAYYWNEPKLGRIKSQNTKIYFVPGNHENWDMFEERIGRHGKYPVEVEKNIFMCPIGSTLKINDKIILFVGGANSIDKQYRIPTVSWWSQEILNYNDFEYISDNIEKADIVISHTVPEYFNVGSQYTDNINDPTRKILNLIQYKYNPELWLAGHWHTYLTGRYNNTNCFILNMINEINWYKEIVILDGKGN